MTNLTDLSHFLKGLPDVLLSAYFRAVGKVAQSPIGCPDVSSIKKQLSITTVQWVYHADVSSNNNKQKQSFLQSIVRPAIEQVKTFIQVTERLNYAIAIFLLLERFLVVLKSPHGLFR